jgi:hypothetical protein
MTKDYYRGEFKRERLSKTTVGFNKEKFYQTDQIKDYRIKTISGKRPFGVNNFNQSTFGVNNFN